MIRQTTVSLAASSIVVPLIIAVLLGACSSSDKKVDAAAAEASVDASPDQKVADTGKPPADTTPDTADAAAPDASTTKKVSAIIAGGDHTCALLTTGAVRCWGRGLFGRLGYANTNNIGDDELPSSAGDIKLGEAATKIYSGTDFNCALLKSGSLRCWGNNANGQLGYANTTRIGDDEHPSSAGPVNLGGQADTLAAGGQSQHTCALRTTRNLLCWGHLGDDETPASAGDVNVGAAVVDVAAGYRHTCAQLTTGKVRCWGEGTYGRLGYANTKTVGDDETPATVGDVNLGAGKVTQVVAGHSHTCALLSTGVVRCWGYNYYGQLGYGHKKNIGDDEFPSTAGDVKVGGTVIQLAAGMFHTCALLSSGTVRCWGFAKYGQLGHANTNWIGDDETPASAGNITVF